MKKPKARPYVLITRRRQIREHNKTAEIIRNEATLSKSFSVFKTEVPERAAIAAALGKTGTVPSFTSKWSDEVVSVLASLATEAKEALNGR